MNKIKYVCKRCGGKDFYFSLSERRNIIFEINDGVAKRKDAFYGDDGEINYFRCLKCDSEIDEYDFNEIIQLAQALL